eukprot:TRINITY_DN72741_c0_g1_i1.p2 TRINITY_DN72741_c0_g1~~TRINITY_DN72741_c0_g1_i1.p2  ORF type:complete len:128 (-),score=2.20 TRINITY_DN72741_c0_g1_i1:119-502(-)
MGFIQLQLAGQFPPTFLPPPVILGSVASIKEQTCLLTNQVQSLTDYTSFSIPRTPHLSYSNFAAAMCFQPPIIIVVTSIILRQYVTGLCNKNNNQILKYELQSLCVKIFLHALLGRFFQGLQPQEAP